MSIFRCFSSFLCFFIGFGAAFASPVEEHVSKKNEFSRKRTIVIAGDSIAQGYGMALSPALDGDWKVLNKGRVSSGLVSKKGGDWVEDLKRLASTLNPDAFILSFGANDAGMPAPGAAFGSSEWEAFYAGRVREAVEAAASGGAKVVWTSVPRMGREPLDKHCETIRKIQERAASEAGAVVAPLNEVAAISKHAMRAKDGVHFTMLGYRQVAVDALKIVYPELKTVSLAKRISKQEAPGKTSAAKIKPRPAKTNATSYKIAVAPSLSKEALSD